VLDHISIRVSDYERSKRFFEAALAPLGYALLFEHGISGAGFGRSGKPDFWIKQGQPSPSLHIAFASEDRAMVDAFYKAAMSCNGRDNGPQGSALNTTLPITVRSFSTPTGTTAVCHKPE
jgi:catechol 2,3-dioxygenase-like lactoylglutathione lyase family enzyme